MTSGRKFSEYAVAATAFFVSVSSLFIYIYQSKIMAEQQQVAAWPYVEWYTSNLEGYKLTVQNKGIGPAIVRKVSLKVDGKKLEGNGALIEAVMGNRDLRWINSELMNRVLSANETTTILTIPDPEQARDYQRRLAGRTFELDITYCSIYGRCWISTGFTTTRAADDSSTMY